jgi:hypothetical protein
MATILPAQKNSASAQHSAFVKMVLIRLNSRKDESQSTEVLSQIAVVKETRMVRRLFDACLLLNVLR